MKIRLVCAIACVLAVPYATLAADPASPATPVVKSLSEQKFDKFPGTPDCLTGSVLNGDPAKGPSLLLTKFAGGCTVPWHWHSSNEHVMMISGTGRLEMKDSKPTIVRGGAYAMLPAHHAHKFTCTASCVLYLYSDGVFDTHYIDANGAEISAEQALAKKSPDKK
jgi:quercetin dioxygenase-like cupin family protein